MDDFKWDVSIDVTLIYIIECHLNACKSGVNLCEYTTGTNQFPNKLNMVLACVCSPEQWTVKKKRNAIIHFLGFKLELYFGCYVECVCIEHCAKHAHTLTE